MVFRYQAQGLVDQTTLDEKCPSRDLSAAKNVTLVPPTSTPEASEQLYRAGWVTRRVFLDGPAQSLDTQVGMCGDFTLIAVIFCCTDFSLGQIYFLDKLSTLILLLIIFQYFLLLFSYIVLSWKKKKQAWNKGKNNINSLHLIRHYSKASARLLWGDVSVSMWCSNFTKH